MKKKILTSLFDILCNIDAEISKYLNSFDTNGQITFADSDEDRKKALAEYNLFSVKLADGIYKCEKIAAEISLLVCKADERCDAEATRIWSAELDRFTDLEAAVSKFTKGNERIFYIRKEEYRNSIAQILARELKLNIENYIRYIKESIL